MRTRRIRSLLLVGVALSLVLAACGGGADPTATSAPQLTAAPQSTATPRPTPVPPTPTPAPTSSGELNIALQQMGQFGLTPAISLTLSTATYLDSMFDYMIGTDDGGNLDDTAGFATSWSTNDDSTVWTVTFRDTVGFHNGDQATAHDVVYTLGLALAETSQWGQGGDLQRDVASLETPDDYTMVTTLNSTNIFWALGFLSRLAPGDLPTFLLPKNYLEAVGIPEANKKPVGSGPYAFKQVIIGDSITVEATDNHWFFGVPRTKTMTYRHIPEEGTRIALLRTGDADLAPISIASTSLVQDAGLRIVQKDASKVGTVYTLQYQEDFNGVPNPLRDEKVRKALSWYAIDRQAIVDSFLQGIGEPTMDYPVSPWDAAYKKHAVPGFDPDKARALLAEAGYPNGFEIDFYNLQPNAFPEGKEVIEALAVYWENIGLKVNRHPIDFAGFATKLIDGKENGWPRPMAGGMYAIGNKFIATSYASNPHNTKSPYAISYDAESTRLATEYQQAKTLRQYIATGQAYQDRAYEGATSWLPIFQVGDVWAGNSKIPEAWKMGRDSNSFRINYAAAFNYEGAFNY